VDVNYAFRNAYKFSDREATTFIIISVLSGFILSFRKWGTYAFDATEGLFNLVIYTLIFLFLFFIFLFTQKFVASLLGLEGSLKVWKYGPPLGVLVTMFSYGLIPFIFIGGLEFKEIHRLRLGKFRHMINIKELLLIGITGPLVLVLLSLLVFFPLFHLTNSFVFFDMIKISSIILIVSILPLPTLNGMNILLKYRWLWLLIFLYSLFLVLLLNFLHVASVFLLALILTLFSFFILWILLFREKN